LLGRFVDNNIVGANIDCGWFICLLLVIGKLTGGLD